MGALERLRLERIAKYDISELPSAGGNKQSRTSTKKPQGQGASTTHTTNISNKIPVPKPEHMGTGGTRIDPKTGKPQVGGERVPIPGTAGGKTGMKRTFNPTGSKETHRTEQGTVGANAEQKLSTGKPKTNKKQLETYFFKHPKTGRAHPVTENQKKELRNTPGGKIDDKLAEIKARKEPKESTTKIDNTKWKPGEKEKLQAKHEKWKERKEEAEKKRRKEIEARRAESEKDTSSEEARIASESKLSHPSQRRTLRRIAEERKRKEEGETKETMYRKRGRKDEKTRHYAWGSDDTPEISEEEYKEGERQIGEKKPTSTEESFPKSTAKKSYEAIKSAFLKLRVERLTKKHGRDAHIDEDIAQTDLAPVGQEIPPSRVAPKSRKEGYKIKPNIRSIHQGENPKISDLEMYGQPGMTISRDTARSLKALRIKRLNKDLNN